MSPDTLSVRLSRLYELAGADYDVAWDLCCDHGYLGAALLFAGRAREVHLVDQVPGIMADLQTRVSTWPAGCQASVILHTERAEWLSPVSGDHQLVMLAGVGGEKTGWILRALTRFTEFANADWILSPANDGLEVRRCLNALNFGLLKEGAVIENGWCYEYLKVRHRKNNTIRSVPRVGEFWDPGSDEHQRHLSRLRRHYGNQLKGRCPEKARAALAAYQPLFERIDHRKA